MIDEKKINQAIGEYLEEEGYKPYIEQAFQDGINWAQKEFINSLWHDASEEPKEGKKCIGLYKCIPLDVIPFSLPIAGTAWDEYIHYSSLYKWCYVDDIMPKEGGKG